MTRLRLRSSLRWAERSTRSVPGPISKEALNFAGYHYSGHTELLADLTGARGLATLLAHGHMRVSHVTTHCALEDVPRRVTPSGSSASSP